MPRVEDRVESLNLPTWDGTPSITKLEVRAVLRCIRSKQ